MIVQGKTVLATHIRAAESVMRGEFSRDDVFNATCAANVPWVVVPEVTRRLIRKGIESGTIRPLSHNRFERVS